MRPFWFRFLHTVQIFIKLNFFSEFVEEDSEDRSQRNNYVDMMQHMLTIEDMDVMKQTTKYDLEFQKVVPFRECRYTLRQSVEKHLKYLMCDKKRNNFQRTAFVIEAQQKMPTDAMEFEYVYITDMIDYQQFHDDLAELKPYRLVARVAYIFDNLILVQVKQPRNRRRQRDDAPKIEPDRNYHVEFIPNRVSTRVAYRALKDLKDADMIEYMKNFDVDVKDRYGDFDDFEWFDSSIEDNEEQQTAIQNIINCTAFPSPYVIFGGKFKILKKFHLIIFKFF